MVDTIEKLNLSTLDKSSWKTYRFDQIAKSISERVDPTNTNLDVYVGLEHIDSDSLHITRFGKREDVTGTKLRCYPGDVIFGRRRAYQRKAAIVEFDGFCSAHSLVLRANPKVIDPKLFPFFLHSDTFMNRAIDISVGSLSPTINWGTLKTQEFLLPPIDQQAELAKLLWSLDSITQKEDNLIQNIATNKMLIFNTLSKLKVESSCNLEDLCKVISSGGTPAREMEGEYYGGTINWIKTKELNDGLISESEEKITELGLKNSSAKLYPRNTILLAMYGVTVGKIAIIDKEMACNQACCAIVIDSQKVDLWFLFYYLLSQRRKFIELSVGSAQPNISSGIVKKFKIPNIPLESQIHYSNKLKKFDLLLSQVIYRKSLTKKLHKSINNQIF